MICIEQTKCFALCSPIFLARFCFFDSLNTIKRFLCLMGCLQVQMRWWGCWCHETFFVTDDILHILLWIIDIKQLFKFFFLNVQFTRHDIMWWFSNSCYYYSLDPVDISTFLSFSLLSLLICSHLLNQLLTIYWDSWNILETSSRDVKPFF